MLQMKVRYSRCIGTELHTGDVERFSILIQVIAFTTPAIIIHASKAAIIAELEHDGAAMLQTGVPELAGVPGARIIEDH